MGGNGTLRAKEARFVEEYLIDLDASKAAKRAGYSEKTAGQIGYQKLQKSSIQAALTAARQAIIAKTGVTPERITQERARLAFFDIGQCYDENGNLLNIKEIPEDSRRAIAGVESFELMAGEGEVRKPLAITKKVKVWDKNRALEALEKQFGLYNADESQKSNPIVVIRDCVAEKRSDNSDPV